MSDRGRRRRALLPSAGALLVVLLAGCGSDSGSAGPAEQATDPSPSSSTSSSTSTSTSPSGSGLPECDAVWVAGQDLPRGYAGCVQDGRVEDPERRRCEFGQTIVEHAGRFYAVPGNVVNETESLAQSPEYRRALRSCQG
ncbi:hypothetical protein [Nocardioides sp. P86]|uniref:hypothetical protein n=1 Tax=Nocardioides sp. P86 TaxID=2939569 RepID=UPI002041FCAB|nr:hypothetical protein [Nocardioides sp. P86]MCM3515824.1 hypothetical protein [Nocardioides sp. P86]